jgi:hypothetical protein
MIEFISIATQATCKVSAKGFFGGSTWTLKTLAWVGALALLIWYTDW